jgi:hypothetical protein
MQDRYVAPTHSRVMLTEYGSYAEAQRAVDHLSDNRFPVANVAIVWDGLRHVEEVTGRRTTARAFAEGALAGAWFGGFLALLIALFVELDGSALALFVTYVLAGALLVGIFRAVGHWLQRGARDFSTLGRFEAQRYQLWVVPEVESQAAMLLGIGPRGSELPRAG